MRSHSKALFAVAALFAFLLVPSSALAEKTVERLITTGGAAGGLGVNTTTGDLYVQIVDLDRIERYDSSGNLLGQFGSSGNGDGQFDFEEAISQLAVDSSDGSVYVADTGNDRIQKFEADGTFIDAFGEEGSGDGQLSEPKGAAVDQASGDVYVADTSNNRVQRFSATGDFEAVVGAGELSAPTQVGVDSTGRIYVLEPFSRIARFSAAGVLDDTYEAQLSSPQGSLGINSANGHAFAFAFTADFSDFGILELDQAGAVVDIHRSSSVGGQNNIDKGMALGSGGEPLYGTSSEQPTNRVSVLTDAGATPPTATIQPVTDVGAHGATFNGQINPNGGLPVDWHFEYSTDGSTWTSTTGGEVSGGSSAVSVSENFTGLEANLDYDVRLVATKAFGGPSDTSGETSFKTAAEAPLVEALYAGVPTDTSAWLGAKVNPQNSPTTFYIEYSADPDFGNSASVPASQDGSAGSGGDFLLVNRRVTGLEPNKTYHFRVVATNDAGAAIGVSRSFETLVPIAPEKGLPDGRVYERVSPADKQGAPVRRGTTIRSWLFSSLSQAADSGEAVAYASSGKFGGDSGPTISEYLARRGPSGWTTEGINPFHEPGFGSGNPNFYEWFSPDLSRAIASTPAGLNPGDPSGIQNLYLRDNQTGVYRAVSNGDESTPGRAWFKFRGASSDGAHVVFQDEGESFETPIFEWTETEGTREVGILPNGTPMPGGTRLGNGSGSGSAAGVNPISANGSRIFFTPRELPAALYVREDGTSTTLLSASERVGDDPEIPQIARFIGASADGSIAYFTSGISLTEDASTDSNSVHLYRWNADAQLGERLTLLASAPSSVIPGTFGVAGMSRDGDTFYFAVAAHFDAGDKQGTPGPPSLYLWRPGSGIHHIADLSIADTGMWEVGLNNRGTDNYRQARVTPDGRVLAFSSEESLTAYDTNGTSQLYLYDRETGKVTCPSCGTFKPQSKKDSWFLSCMGESLGYCEAVEYLTRNLSKDGKRLFFDSQDALVPQDTNGATDVYEWSEGRLHLLSSGTSGTYSGFHDASADGDDVFFTTAQSLVPSDDDDLIDLYDARVGGVPEPPVVVPCVADECQATPSAPTQFQTPASSGFSGEGNVRSAAARCRKGKVRRKGRCTPRKSKRHGASRRAKNNRRAGG